MMSSANDVVHRIVTAVVDGDRIEADDQAPVPWWSFTKTVIAAAALVLVARNRLQLDDRIGSNPFTLRQLLQHRAGIPDYGALASYHAAVAAGDDPWPVNEVLQRAGAATLLCAPGERFAYSNIGYLWVRQMIEDAANVPIAAAIRELVFNPLGIGRSCLAEAPEDLDRTAWGNARRYHPGWVYHGLLVGPAGDAALLLHRLMDGALIADDLLAAMRLPLPVCGLMPDRPWLSVDYGLGLGICRTHAPGQFIGHTGEGPGSTAAVYRFMPDDGDASAKCCTAAAFAPIDAPSEVEGRVVALALRRYFGQRIEDT